MKKLVILIAMLAMGASICFSQKKDDRLAAPSITIQENGKEYSLVVKELAIDVKIVGTLAVTTLDMTFASTYPRVLEGELNFPLADGQTVSRYSLEVNGKMREGVSVEKAQGRVAFENTIRQRIDPGLLEMTRGNSFKSRIYPIPANGTKRIIIAYEQYLTGSAEGLLYTLPLNFKDEIKKFTLAATVVSDAAPDARSSELKAPAFAKNGSGFATLITRTNYSASEQFSFTVPNSGRRTTWLTQDKDGKTYFYINTFPTAETRPRALPKNICILYDVSSGTDGRDAEREAMLLSGLFAGRSAHVEFVPFAIAPDETEIFEVASGDWSAIKSRMESLKYDGGTDFSTIDFTKYAADEFFIFTDGIANFGAKEFGECRKPITFVNSMQNADHSYMRFVASATGGNYFNLKSMTDEQITSALGQSARMFLSAEYSAAEIEETYPRIATLADGSFTICGIMKSAKASLKLNFGFNGVAETSETIEIKQGENQSDLVRKIWAMKKLAHLQMRSEKNKTEIVRLGKSMTLVTPYTSLIVLDRVEDYARYEIEPPEELRAEYTKLIAKQRDDKVQDSINHAKQVLDMFDMKFKWWEKEYTPKKFDFVVNVKDSAGNLISGADVTLFDGATSHVANETKKGVYMFSKIPEKPYRLLIEKDKYMLNITKLKDISNIREMNVILSKPNKKQPGVATGSNDQEKSMSEVGTVDISEAVDLQLADRPAVWTAAANEEQIPEESAFSQVESQSVLEPSYDNSSTARRSDKKVMKQGSRNPIIQTEEPRRKANIALASEYTKEEYYAPLEKAFDFYSKYLELKPQYGKYPVYFIDASRIASERGMKQLALRILSNIAEMELENRQLMRVLGNRLLQIGYAGKAVQTLEDVLKIAEEEPQSYRDLAIAYAENGDTQRAVEMLYSIATKDWHGRFPEVELIALNEMNNVIAQAKTPVNTDGIDSRLIKNMPVGLRVVLNWDSDNTDIDLWVTDPADEKCFYSHNRTKSGGRISRDFTGGYGPEEYMIRRPLSGKYRIEANYFGTRQQNLHGPTTIYLDIYTDYGTPQEKKRTITLPLKTNKEIVKVGEIVVD